MENQGNAYSLRTAWYALDKDGELEIFQNMKDKCDVTTAVYTMLKVDQYSPVCSTCTSIFYSLAYRDFFLHISTSFKLPVLFSVLPIKHSLQSVGSFFFWIITCNYPTARPRKINQICFCLLGHMVMMIGQIF